MTHGNGAKKHSALKPHRKFGRSENYFERVAAVKRGLSATVGWSSRRNDARIFRRSPRGKSSPRSRILPICP